MRIHMELCCVIPDDIEVVSISIYTSQRHNGDDFTVLLVNG